MISSIVVTLLLLILLIFAFYWLYAIFAGAPYYPSSKKAISKIVAYAKTTKKLRVAELGSGDGRMALALARSGFEVTAYEINPLLTLLTTLRAKLLGVKLNVKQANFLLQDLSEYDIFVAYLYPKIMQKLYAKLKKEAKPGAIIISNTFSIKEHKPLQQLDEKILIYKING